MAGEEFTCFDPDQPSGRKDAEFAEFVDTHDWQFARTRPANPHEYTLRRNTSDSVFDAAVRYIREHGYIERFAGRPYKTLYFGDHQYWTMGAPQRETVLINRKPRLADSPADEVG